MIPALTVLDVLLAAEPGVHIKVSDICVESYSLMLGVRNHLDGGISAASCHRLTRRVILVREHQTCRHLECVRSEPMTAGCAKQIS